MQGERRLSAHAFGFVRLHVALEEVNVIWGPVHPNRITSFKRESNLASLHLGRAGPYAEFGCMQPPWAAQGLGAAPRAPPPTVGVLAPGRMGEGDGAHLSWHRLPASTLCGTAVPLSHSEAPSLHETGQENIIQRE